MHESATSVHGNMRLSSIYTSEAGEWKLSGLEVLTNLKEDETAIFVFVAVDVTNFRRMGVCCLSQDDTRHLKLSRHPGMLLKS